jgi:outer membrane protein assembly factor BamB
MRGWLALALGLCVACSTPQPQPASPAATSAPQAAPQSSQPAASPAKPVASAPAAASVAPQPSPSPVAAQPSAVAAQPSADWPTYQKDLLRSGVASGTYDAANTRQLWESEQVDGQVYAQPLVVQNRVIIATQNNSVYALEAATGRTAWMQHLGDPVPRSMLPCGNIDPTGITSTPVADPASGLLYVVDYLKDGPRHELVALELTSGSVRFHEPIDPPGASVLPLQQRGALGLSNANVYVPFGGLFGDCGNYHGWVIGAGAADGRQRAAYQVPTQREGAIWAATSFNAAGDVFAATGNGSSTSDFDGANAVVRLSQDLKLLDFFAPSDWADLSRRDADLGSAGPILLDNNRILQVGKSGVGYLLDVAALGRIGGQLYQAPICSAGAYGGAGHAGIVAYVGCRDGLYAVQVQDRSFAVVWRGPQVRAGAPTLTDRAVWTVDDSSANLYALDRQTGGVLFRAPAGQASNPPHFLTPAAANGRIFQSRSRTIIAYGAN